MQSRWMTGVTMLAVVASTPGPIPMAQAQGQSAKGSQGFCRNAAPLPQLGLEADARQQSHSGHRPTGTMRDRAPLARPAPPPPPVSSPAISGSVSESAADAVVVTGSRVGRDTSASAPSASGDYRMPPPMVPSPRYPQPQSGVLTAGEHDDLLNPELYAAYIKRSNLGQDIRDLPRVDTARVVTVQVTDYSGRPVPFVDVVVTCSDGNQIKLATQADGTVSLFPSLDRLSESVRIGARKGLRPIADERRVLVADAAGGQTIKLTTRERPADVRKLDLMLVIDTTGSMGDEIRYLQAEMRSIIAAITAKHRNLDIRVGFVFYRDIGDDYVTRTIGFDSNIGRAQGVLAQQDANGGGDYPEAMDQAMIRAVGQDWRPDAVKSLLLVADAPPHDQSFGRTWQAAEVAREKRIHITPVAASGVADKAEYAMRAMAAATQSRYLFLTDDSGVGNPHAPPAIDCYLVTRLDALVRRVIDSQLSGRRIEPEKREVIRSVGQYDAGKCVLPDDFRSQS